MSDRFLVELRRGVSLGSSSAGGNLSKSEREVEAKLELVIRGMEHFQLRVSLRAYARLSKYYKLIRRSYLSAGLSTIRVRHRLRIPRRDRWVLCTDARRDS